MSNFTAVTMAGMLNQFFAGTWHVALYTSMPTVMGGGIELAEPGYSRAEITLPTGTSTYRANTNTVEFPEAQTDWVDILGIGILTASVGGTLRAFHTFDAPITISAGMRLYFEPGQIEVGFVGGA